MTGESTVVKTYPIHSLIKPSYEDEGVRSNQRLGEENTPVSVYVTGVDVVGALQASDWLEADAGCFIGHDVDQSVLEFVARQVGCDKPGRVGFGVSKSLDGGRGKLHVRQQITFICIYCIIYSSITLSRQNLEQKILHAFNLKLLPHLKLQLHAGDVLSTLHLGQLLHVGVQTPGGHLGVPAGYGLQQGLVDETVLVLCLHHVVPL